MIFDVAPFSGEGLKSDILRNVCLFAHVRLLSTLELILSSLRGAVLVVLLLRQAARTRLHGDSHAHAAASHRHVCDTGPFVPLRTVALNTGQEAVLVKTPWRKTHKQLEEEI